MANISKEVWVEDLEKLADGTYKRKNHIAKARNGVTFDEHLAESTQQAHLAKNIGLEDTAGNFTSTELEGAMQELFTNVSNGKSLVGRAITGVDDSVVIPTDPTFQDLAEAIKNIEVESIQIIPGDDVLLAQFNTNNLSGSNLKEPQLVSEVLVNRDCGLRVSFDLRSMLDGTGSEWEVLAQVYINGQPIGIERSSSSDWRTFTEDFELNEGDLVQLYSWTYASDTKGQIWTSRNFTFRATINSPSIVERII